MFRRVIDALGTSDYSLTFVKVDAKAKPSSDMLLHRTLHQYNKADLGRIRYEVAEEPHPVLFKMNFLVQPPSFPVGYSSTLKALSLT